MSQWNALLFACLFTFCFITYLSLLNGIVLILYIFLNCNLCSVEKSLFTINLNTVWDEVKIEVLQCRKKSCFVCSFDGRNAFLWANYPLSLIPKTNPATGISRCTGMKKNVILQALTLKQIFSRNTFPLLFVVLID